MENENAIISVSSAVELTGQQKSAAEAIKSWYLGSKTGDDQTFALAGYAGTGKTFLIDYVIQNILKLKPSEVAFAAPTGKAAMVLIQKGRDAHTIHRLIYHEDSRQYITFVNGKPIIHTSMHFSRIADLPKEYKLIVIDEVSMVSERMMSDILSFGRPVLCCGDPGQLEPVASGMNHLIKSPDAILSEIVRQAGDSPILRLATDVRSGKPIIPGDYGEGLRIIPKWTMSDSEYMDTLLGADQVICGRNSTRKAINDAMRKALGYSGDLPNAGEKIICCSNNYGITVDKNCEFSLINGCIGTATKAYVLDADTNICGIGFKPDFLDDSTEGIVTDMGAFKNHEFTYDQGQKVYLMPDKRYVLAAPYQSRIPGESRQAYNDRVRTEILNRRRAEATIQINQFDYAYAISCHKSQGSEFDRVVVIDESGAFREERSKWLYTAITRAKKSLTIIEP